MEMGPYLLDNSTGTLTPVPRNYTWSTYFHLLFIDNPSTVGYSIPGTENVTSTTIAAQELLVFLEQFFQEYPILADNDFYIFGESYGGHYIPALAYEILTSNSTQIQLSGIGIGNAWTDPVNQLGYYASYCYAAGLVDENDHDTLRQWELQAVQAIESGDLITANNLFNTIEAYIQDANVTGGVFINNYYQYFPNVPILAQFALAQAWLSMNSTQQMMNVSLNPSYQLCNAEIYQWWQLDMMTSVADKLSYVLANLDVLLYNGADDIEVNTSGVLNFLEKLSWEGAEGFMETERQIWNTQEGVAGNVKSSSNLTFVTIYGSGHIVPFDQPVKAIDMVVRWVNGDEDWGQPGAY